MAEKNSAQTNRHTNRHYENNGHLAVNQQFRLMAFFPDKSGSASFPSGPPLPPPVTEENC